jgi:Flp pilus assembly protein protease CpaA
MELLIGIPFLGAAAVWNSRCGIVPNALVAGFLLAFVPVAWISEIPLAELAARVTAFLASLLVFLMLFSRRLIGGGTAKLVAVTALWLPPSLALLLCAISVALALLFRITEGDGSSQCHAALGRQFATIMSAAGIVLLAASA